MLTPIATPAAGPGRLVGRAHEGPGRALARFGEDHLVSVGDDGAVCVWDASGLTQRIELDSGGLVAVAANDAFVAVGGPRGLWLMRRAGAGIDLGVSLRIKRAIDGPTTAIAASGDCFLVGGEDALYWIDPGTGAIDVLPPPKHRIEDIVMLEHGAAVHADGELLWVTDDGIRSHELHALAPEAFHGSFLRPHSAPGRVLLGVHHEAMCLYIVLRLLSFDPATGEHDEIGAGGDGCGGEPWVLGDGTTVWVGGRVRPVGYNKRWGRWDLAVEGMQATAVLAGDKVLHLLDRTGALRRFDLEHGNDRDDLGDRGQEPVRCGTFVRGTSPPDHLMTWDATGQRLRQWALDDGRMLSETSWGHHKAETSLQSNPG